MRTIHAGWIWTIGIYLYFTIGSLCSIKIQEECDYGGHGGEEEAMFCLLYFLFWPLAPIVKVMFTIIGGFVN